jgi:hypothetical protein
MIRVTAFVTTIGGRTLRACVERILEQCPVTVIERVAPYAEAKQSMVDLCETEMFVMVGEDMLLYPNAIASLVALIDRQPPDVVMATAPLWDVDLEMPIYGLKIWRHALVQRVPFVSHPEGDRHDRERLAAAGLAYVKTPRDREHCLGDHGTDYTPADAFTRWRRLWQRHRRTGASQWIEPWIERLRSRMIASGRQRDVMAFLGACVGRSEPAWPDDFDPYDYRNADPVLDRITEMLGDDA